MILLRYDTRHIRAFFREGDFLKPLPYADTLLPLAENIFASSSSLRAAYKNWESLLALASLLEKEPLHLEVLKAFPLEIRFEGRTYQLNEERTLYWEKTFWEDSLLHTAACRFQIPHSGKAHLKEFFAELGISPPSGLLAVSEGDFFLPMEFLAGELFCFYQKIGKISSGRLRSLHLLYDRNLAFAEEEAQRIAYLIKKRGLRLEGQAPDILFAADHGHADGHLENFVLEEKILAYKPKLTVVNSCSVAQGGFADKITGACILSPYATEADKSVFAPLLRFLASADRKSLLAAFGLACIFYPNLANYYRLYLPWER